jgi:CYTH domain-containing protein
MAEEIERRFLVQGDQWRRHVLWSARLQQGYLARGPGGLVLRVRSRESIQSLDGDSTLEPTAAAWITIKAGIQTGPGQSALSDTGPGDAGALRRLEFEYPVPVSDAAALLALTPSRLSKCRHGLDLPGGEWVLDEFEGANAPLVVAEVELDRVAQQVEVPSWCVTEITHRRELSNAALASRPLQLWGEERKAELLSLARRPRASSS